MSFTEVYDYTSRPSALCLVEILDMIMDMYIAWFVEEGGEGRDSARVAMYRSVYLDVVNFSH